MEHILEFFDFFKKNKVEPKTPKTWEDKVEFIYKSFKDIKENDPKDYYYLEAEVKGTSYDFSYNFFNKKEGSVRIHILLRKTDDSYEVTDFEEVDMSDYKSNKGHYKVTKEQYNKYLKYCEEISDYLDDKSDSSINKSASFISDNGDINLDNLELDNLNYELEDKFFNKYLDKEFEFEVKYNLWNTASSNEKVIERRLFKISDIKVDYDSYRFFATIETKGVLNEVCSIRIERDYKVEYVDMSKQISYGDALRVSIKEETLSRKQKRDIVSKYPNIIFYEITPSKYNTIEFLKELTDLLRQLTDSIKK